MSGGFGCKCMAICEGDCCCDDVDWRSSREVELENKCYALAEQNRLLREALEFLNSRIVTMELGGVVERALNLPDPSASILNQRDARVLREAADKISYRSNTAPSDQLREMAAEKEKQ